MPDLPAGFGYAPSAAGCFTLVGNNFVPLYKSQTGQTVGHYPQLRQALNVGCKAQTTSTSMLSAADLNSKFDEFANQFLLPIGFAKSGIHYYKKTDKEYFAIIKDTSRGFFLDYYLCYCPSVAATQFKLLQKKPSSMLKDYPVSIAIDDLEIVYTNNENLLYSPFYFYSLSRQFKVDKDCTENISVWNEYYRRIIVRNEQLTTNSLYLQNFVTTLFSSLQKYGFRFFNECSIDLCYQSVKRAFNDKKMAQYSTYYTELISQFEEYYQQNNLQTPEIIIKKKQNWLSRFFSSN